MTNPEMFDHFSWPLYAGICAVYTGILVFNNQRWSKSFLNPQNKVPFTLVLRVHLEFLAVLLILTWSIAHWYPKLPHWLSVTVRTRRSRITWLDFLFMLSGVVLTIVEESRIRSEARRHRRVHA